MATRRELDLRLEAFRELLWHKSQLMATIPFDRRVMRLTVGCEIRDISGITPDGRYYSYFNGECILFPSKDQRDWSKLTAPWYKKERFEPKSLKPFDKVLVRDGNERNWVCDFFSHIGEPYNIYMCISIVGGGFKQCIPYNDDTKHLVGTNEEAPEFYRYWED